MPDLPKLPPAKFIEFGAFKNAYFVLGPKEGRPLLLCHGLAANGLQFVEDAHFFAEHGFYVIVPDLRGHGRSETPKNWQSNDFSIQRMAADLIAILDKEEIENTDWVGNSLGGIIALSLMGTDAHRLNRSISFGTSHTLSVPTFSIDLFLMSHRIFGGKLLASMGAPMTCRDEKARAIIYEMISIIDADIVAAIAKHLGQYDLRQEALSFKNPMMIVQGERDRAVNNGLKSSLPGLNKMSNFTLLDLKNAGHCANLDQPEKMRRIVLDFLADGSA